MNRKPRQPRPLINTMLLATHRASKLSPQQQSELMISARAAVEALALGHGSVDVWSDMADVLNISEALCELTIAGNLRATVDEAQSAMAVLMGRAKQGRGWTLYGPELTALRESVWLYSVQINLCSAGEHLRAIDIVRNRITGALAGNASRGAVVHDASSLETT